MTRNLSDPDDTWWTIDQAAEHFGIRRESILRYIREGLATYGKGKLIRRQDALAEFRRRRRNELTTRAKPTPPA